MTDTPSPELAELTTDIVKAYVSNNAVRADDVPNLIQAVNAALLRTTQTEIVPEREPLSPAVPIKKSVQSDHLVCLEDGKHFKSLKRHLSTHHAMTPEDYREKWGLPATYPMVAPSYAAARSALAKEMGLGRKEEAPAPEPEKPKRAPRKRAAKPKASSAA